MRAFLIVAAVLGTLYSHGIFAEGSNPYFTPIGLGLIPPAQFPPEKFAVNGIRVSALMGSNRAVHGIDIGLIGNKTREDFAGFAVAGVFNYNKSTARIYGAQIAGITNINKGETRVIGLQAAIGANISDHTDIYGVQVGLYNRARKVYGLQVGLVNIAADLHGLQIGLANFNDGGYFRVSPIINFGF